jgi:hypothetical protein
MLFFLRFCKKNLWRKKTLKISPCSLVSGFYTFRSGFKFTRNMMSLQTHFTFTTEAMKCE